VDHGRDFLALSIRFILFGLMAPFAGRALNRYGFAQCDAVGLMIVASALVASLLMTKVWHLMLLWGVVIGVGTGMTGWCWERPVAARWFSARRGLVVGILTASVATETIDIPAATCRHHRTMGGGCAVAGLLMLALQRSPC